MYLCSTRASPEHTFLTYSIFSPCSPQKINDKGGLRLMTQETEDIVQTHKWNWAENRNFKYRTSLLLTWFCPSFLHPPPHPPHPSPPISFSSFSTPVASVSTECVLVQGPDSTARPAAPWGSAVSSVRFWRGFLVVCWGISGCGWVFFFFFLDCWKT